MPQQAIDLKIKPYIHVLSVGRSGSGKSYQALQWEVENGVRPKTYVAVLDHRFGQLRGLENVEYDRFSSIEQLDKSIEELKNIALTKPENFPYRNYLFCGLTAWIDLAILDIVKLLGFTRSKGGNTTEKGHKIGSTVIPDQEHYLGVTEATRQLYYNGLCYFPCNLFLEAHIVNAYSKDGTVNGTRVLATDKISEKVPGFFDETWEFICTERAMAHAKPIYSVKFRSDLAKTCFEKFPVIQQLEDGKSLYDSVKGMMK